jgi:hypothetical protein
MELKCIFYTEGWWPNNRPKYTCRVDNQPITDRKITWFNGNHEADRHNDDITAVWFEACPMQKIPKNLVDFFANLDTLYINSCGLKSLTSHHLDKIPNLRELLVINNDLTRLSDDFFSSSKHLELVTLTSNKISRIGEKFVKKCASDKLRMIDLRGNPGINAVFAKETSLFPDGDDYLRISSLKKLEKIVKVEKKSRTTEHTLANDVKSLLADDRFRDFTVTINHESFKIHKFILVARSPVIAQMINDNPSCDKLQLVDIPVGVFHSLIAFIYHDELPVDDANLIEIYAAACKLQVTGLKEHASENLIDSVCDVNAVEVLAISCKYGDEDLMVKSFEEIRKMFPDKRLKGELMHQPEKVREMVAAKRAMDEQVKMVKEKFDRQFSGI